MSSVKAATYHLGN